MRGGNVVQLDADDDAMWGIDGSGTILWRPSGDVGKHSRWMRVDGPAHHLHPKATAWINLHFGVPKMTVDGPILTMGNFSSLGKDHLLVVFPNGHVKDLLINPLSLCMFGSDGLVLLDPFHLQFWDPPLTYTQILPASYLFPAFLK